MNSNWILWALLIYSFVLVCLGRYAYKHTIAAGDYFHAGRKCGVLNIVIYGGGFWGAIILVSEIEASFMQGISVMWYGIGTLLMSILIAYWVLAPLRKKHVVTLSGFLGDRFGEPVRAVSGAIIGLFMPIFAIGTIVAPARILSVLYNWPTWESVAFCAIVLLGYVLFGGMLSLTLTGTINTIMMYLGLITTVGAIIYLTGFKELFTKLPANYYDPIGVGIPLILVWIGTWVVNSLVAQAELQMLLTCKDESVGKRGLYLSMIPRAFMTIMAPLVGIGLRLIFPQQNSGLVTLALLIKEQLPMWVSIIIVLGIWAASLVWGAGCQFSGASSVGRDIGKALGISHTEQHEKLHTQIALIIVTLILVIFATLRPTQAAWWSVFAFTVRNSSLIALMLAALIWAAMSVRAAYVSMAAGGVLSFVWYAIASFSTTNFYLGIHPMWIGMSVALFAATLWMVGESLYSKRVRMVWAGVDTKNTHKYVLSAIVIFLGGFILYDRHWLLLKGVLGPLLFAWSFIFFYVGTLVVVGD